ncbi:AraC family transcriptional regulator [Paenibacillus koleovorans]|uniref:AraC family transcriptional regulator n=1 Tax=Paenibacillus koleovorans TaxID=121608 RepID=UPI0013E39B59|nr:AraC family transcriptional regulator [Paenibacillus koleovorans]
MNSDHIQRMNTVMNFIADNLGEILTIPVLAEQGHYAPYHFQRVFKAYAGVTVNDFITRMRIQHARKMLLFQSGLDITSVAIVCGFNSSANFSRKFKSLVGLKPTEYRNKYRVTSSLPKKFSPEVYAEASRLQIRIKETPPMRVAYVRHMHGFLKSGMHPGIQQAYSKLYRYLLKNNALNERERLIGISLDDPYVIPIQSCRFDACFPCDERLFPGEDVCIRTIPGGLCAVAELDGPRELVWDLMHYMHVDWLPKSRYELDYRPFMEMFGQCAAQPGTHVYMPVQLKA